MNMNECFEGLITEVENDMETAYVLEDENLFYDIGFKVMQNQQNQVLFHCNKLKYNGKTKLVYFTSDYQSVADLCGRINIERVCLLIDKLIQAIGQIESLGFLNMAFVDNRLTHIFVDRTEQEVKFIYLPVSEQKIRKNKNIFENELKSQLIRLVEEQYQVSDAKTGMLLQTLKDATLTIQQVGRIVAKIATDVSLLQKTSTEKLNTQILNQSAQTMADVYEERAHEVQETIATSVNGQWKIVGINNSYEFILDKSEFIVGKSRDRVDGVISDNSAVSRVHCKFVKQSGGVSVIDLGSANGTYIEGSKLAVNVPQKALSGNCIRIANMDFILRG